MVLVEANSHLAVSLHRLLAEEKGNVFFSPFSISTAMGMVLCAAEGETEAEMRKGLGYTSAEITKKDIVSAFQDELSDFLGSTDFYKLTCANSVLVQKDFAIKDAYKEVLTQAFKALLLEVDFRSGDSSKVVDQINDWVRVETNGMIEQLIQNLDPEAVIVLLNAVYFKGSWLHQFGIESTRKQDFYNGGKSEKATPVDMMRIKESFKYTKKDTFQAVELPYRGEKFAMLILLPDAVDGLEALEKELSPSFVRDLQKEMVASKLFVDLPRFSLNYSKSLPSCFQKLGIRKLFQKGAELGSASDFLNLAVSDVVHKAVLEVNEEGSEAAAATVVIVVKRKAVRIPEFVVNHPFAFAIYDTKSKIILFMGRVEEL